MRNGSLVRPAHPYLCVEQQRTTHFYHIVHRFRMSNRTVSSVPLSDASQRITAKETQIEKEGKGDVEEVRAEVYGSNASNGRDSAPVVSQEEEQFEWREVIRGMPSFFPPLAYHELN